MQIKLYHGCEKLQKGDEKIEFCILILDGHDEGMIN